MTNKEYLFSSNLVLAEKLVHIVTEIDYDYDWDENLVENGTIDCYECPDGATFGGYGYLSSTDYEEAVQHTIEWLYGEYEEENKTDADYSKK